MAKRFRLRLSRIIPSFRPTSRSKTNPVQANPVPSFFRHSRINPTHAKLNFPSTTTTTITPPPPNNQRRSFLNRHVSSAFCCLRSNPTLSDAEAPDFQWKKEDEFHVIAKVYDEMPRRKIYTSSNSGRSDVEDDVLPPAPPPSAAKKKRRGKKKTRGKIRISTSSAESGIFSDDGEETETLMSSSRSFSTESSPEKNLELETICEAAPIDNLRRRRNKSSKKAKRARKSATKKLSWSSSGTPEIESPARLSVFQRMIPCSVDGKVRESYAVVKKSEDPYEDFKRSMMEMILEKQMFDDDDLEQLLHCFLSLNSRQYHGVIVQAFSEIWETLFCTRSVSGRRDSCFL